MKRKSQYRYLPVAIAVFFVGGGYLGLSTTLASTYSPLGFLQQADTAYQKASSSKPGKIMLDYDADVLRYDAAFKPGVQRLIGNVVFRHDNATMYCDSAHMNDANQTFEAFGNVHMLQGDTVNMYARYLFYDGRSKLAQLRYDVRLENTTTTVFADSLDYDRVEDVAYYFEGGSVVDAQNTLTSDYGQFFPATNDAEFRDNVKLVNDSTELTTEHLYYNTQTRIARFEGQTLVRADSGTIVSRRGVYDMNHDVAILLDRSELRSGSRLIVGDSIYYDGVTKYGEAFGNMEIIDTLQKANLYGDYGYLDSERNYAFATSRARAIDYSQGDTLHIGADTLELISRPLPDSIRARQLADTLEHKPDTLSRLIKAYHRVRVFRSDMQAVADSMTYASLDSVLSFYQKPIMWSEQRQISGDTICMYLADNKINYADVLGNAFAIEEMPDRPEYYNQLKGLSLRAYIQDTTIRRIHVEGEVESVFYMRDEKAKQYNGLNRMTSKAMDVYLDSGLLKKVHWQGEAHGKLYPMHMAQSEEVNRLSGFAWVDAQRPKSPLDVLPQVSDSTSRPEIPNTLASLKRFSGANAAIAAYAEQDRLEAQRAKQHQAANAAGKPVQGDMSTYQYILRPKEDTSVGGGHQSNQWLDLSWLYNPFTDSEDPASLSTSPYIGIPARRN